MIQGRTHLSMCKNFKKLRKHLKLTQTEFGKFLGLTRYTVGAIEELRAEVSSATIKKIIDVGLLDRKDLYSFMFLTDFEIKYKKFKSATDRIKFLIKNKPVLVEKIKI